ncbi:hypothetical protein MTR67_017793 [Solanum verrucosum]|uniref:Protein kinase domain-containing protein n=1 Tax=Solanum verrucosum TaxID=315347 RepID=A0AAF0QL79_SOLVR|nr:hypothetical protein MTR67_017793 [Solanum verrucosum]
MADLLWKRGTTLGQGSFGVVSLASTSNALFRGVTLPSLISLKSWLSCIHNNGMIHCDIKPGNILLVGRDKTAKIANFGISVILEQGMNQKQGLIREQKGIWHQNS